MASALMNMMMDEEKKTSPAAPAARPQTGQQPAGNVPAQMPPPPVPGTPAQVEGAGVGPSVPSAQPAAPATQAAPIDVMSLLAQGRGPINPASAEARPAPARGGRALPPRGGRALPPRAGAPTPPLTPEPTPTYVDPALDVAADLSIDPTLPRDAYLQQLAQQPETRGLPEDQERELPTVKRRSGVVNPFLNTPVQPEDIEAKRYSMSQGFTTDPTGAEETPVAKFLKEFDPLKPAFDENTNANNRSLEIADRVISAATGRFSSTNPLAPLKQVWSSLQSEINALQSKRQALLRGDVNAVMETLPLIESDPVAQAMRGTQGATMDVMREELRGQGFGELKGTNQYVKSELQGIDQQITDIQNSAGYKALKNTIDLAGQASGSNAQRVARGGLAFMLGLKADDSSAERVRAQRYFANERMAAGGMALKTDIETGFEDMLAQTPGFEKYFKRGGALTFEQQGQRQKVKQAYASEIIKTSTNAVLRDFQTGKTMAPALSARNLLVMDFVKPILERGDFTAYDSTMPPWVRHMQRNIANLIDVADPNIGKVIDLPSGPARDALLKTAAGSYSGKSFINNLFDFNYKGREAEFTAASNIVNQRMAANDPQGAALALAPYASDDQLRLIFGEENTTNVGIFGEQANTFKDPYTAPLEQMTGFSGSRRQRIEAHRALQIRTLFAERRRQESQSGLSSGRPVLAGLAAMHGISPKMLGLPQSEDVTSTYNAFLNTPEDLKMNEAARYSEDLVHFITPNVDDKMNYVPDESWDQSVRSLDLAIFELDKNLNSGVIAKENQSNARILLDTLIDSRDTARAQLESGLEVGTNRGILFRTKGSDVDYSQPIKALTGKGRTAQAIDMIGAWVAGVPGVDVNDYFQAKQRSIVNRPSTIIGFDEDVDGNPIQSKPIYQGKQSGVVNAKVFRKVDGKYEPATDAAGRQIIRRKAIDPKIAATSSALQMAQSDQTTVGVDANYVRLQVNGFARDIMGMMADATDQIDGGEGGAIFGSRQDMASSFEQITGIPVEKNGRFTFSDFNNFLTTMPPYKGKQLLGWLNTFSKTAVTAPSSRVSWAMNATSDRGKSKDVSDRAIANIERGALADARGSMQNDMQQTWHSVTATARNIVNEMEARTQFIDAEADLTSTKNIITREILKNHKGVNDSTPSGQLILRNLDQWLDAYIKDDPAGQIAIHKQAQDNIRSLIRDEAPVVAEQNIKTQIRRGNAATITPEEKKAREDEARQRKIDANNKRQERARQESAARRNKTQFYKHNGKWVELRTSNGEMLNAEEARTVTELIAEGKMDTPEGRKYLVNAEPVTSIATLKRLDPKFKAPTNLAPGALRTTTVKPPAAPKAGKGSTVKKNIGGGLATGLVMGMYDISQRRRTR
jgi:hypothetical protein